jgi:predicted methyltransferase
VSTIEDSKTVFEICKENDLPISSTYKKIKKLKDLGLLFIDRIVINEKGKKVVFYKSKIQSVELILNKKQVLLQFKKNERNLPCSISQ